VGSFGFKVSGSNYSESQEVNELNDYPRPHDYIKLKGVEAYRIRVGDYRIINEIKVDKLIVIVVKIGHRREVYD